jgi:hypothetical protein
VVAFPVQFHNSLLSLLHSSVNVHAALKGSWHRWQPFNVAVAMPYWWEASWRELSMPGGGGEMGQMMAALVFWLGDG